MLTLTNLSHNASLAGKCSRPYAGFQIVHEKLPSSWSQTFMQMTIRASHL